jgi:hypothetical protein
MKNRTMKPSMRISLILFILLFSLTNARSGRSAKTSAFAKDQKRIQFQIATVEEKKSERTIISSALIEGPPGTDFDIDVNGERFKMSAKFLTDLDDNNRLHLRARLQTRRLYGYSERRLPLYEEDQQQQTLQLGFDEEVILLPFGQKGGDDKLKIEITPVMTENSVFDPSGKLRSLEIKMLKISPGGIISYQARKLPHRFAVEASLLEDGQEVARADARLLLQEAQELLLQPTSQAGAGVADHPISVNLTISDFIRSRPVDQISIDFDVFRLAKNNPSPPLPIAQRWAGIGLLDSALTYDLSEIYLQSAGKKYELRFKIKGAEDEPGD